MKIIITEDQYDYLKFRRRLEDFEKFIQESPVYKKPCRHANNEDEFVRELLRDITSELHDTDVPLDFIGVVEEYVSVYLQPELAKYFRQKCGSINEGKEEDERIESLIKSVGERYKSDPWIVKTKILGIEKKKGLTGNVNYYEIWPKFIIKDLEGNFPHIEKHLLAQYIEDFVGLPIHSNSARIEYDFEDDSESITESLVDDNFEKNYSPELSTFASSDKFKKIYPMIEKIDVYDLGFGLIYKIFVNDPEMNNDNMYSRGLDPHYFLDKHFQKYLPYFGIKKNYQFGFVVYGPDGNKIVDGILPYERK